MNRLSISLNRVKAKLKKDLEDSLNSRRMKELGEFLVDRIRIRTRLGYGVSGDGKPRRKLKPLAPLSKEIRKDYRKMGELSDLTTANKSNLTFTGQMLDNLVVTAVSAKKFTIDIVGFRRPPKVLEKKKRGKKNKQTLAQKVIGAGKKAVESNAIYNRLRKSHGDELRTNKEVAQKVTDEGRPFMYLTDKDYKAVINFIRDGFKSILKKRLTR